MPGIRPPDTIPVSRYLQPFPALWLFWARPARPPQVDDRGHCLPSESDLLSPSPLSYKSRPFRRGVISEVLDSFFQTRSPKRKPPLTFELFQPLFPLFSRLRARSRADPGHEQEHPPVEDPISMNTRFLSFLALFELLVLRGDGLSSGRFSFGGTVPEHSPRTVLLFSVFPAYRLETLSRANCA